MGECEGSSLRSETATFGLHKSVDATWPHRIPSVKTIRFVFVPPAFFPVCAPRFLTGFWRCENGCIRQMGCLRRSRRGVNLRGCLAPIRSRGGTLRGSGVRNTAGCCRKKQAGISVVALKCCRRIVYAVRGSSGRY
jgi:hypothetical protein